MLDENKVVGKLAGVRDLRGDHIALGEHVLLDGLLALLVVLELHGKGLGETIISLSKTTYTE